MFDGRRLTSLAMLAIFAGASLIALGLPTKAAFFPLMIGIPGTLLCAAQLVIDLRRPAPAAAPAPAPDSGDATPGVSEQVMLVWLGLFLAALVGLGFLVGGPLIVAAYVRFVSRDSWKNALFAGAGTFATIFGVFYWLLDLRLFPGLLLMP